MRTLAENPLASVGLWDVFGFERTVDWDDRIRSGIARVDVGNTDTSLNSRLPWAEQAGPWGQRHSHLLRRQQSEVEWHICNSKFDLFVCKFRDISFLCDAMVSAKKTTHLPPLTDRNSSDLQVNWWTFDCFILTTLFDSCTRIGIIHLLGVVVFFCLHCIYLFFLNNFKTDWSISKQ